MAKDTKEKKLFFGKINDFFKENDWSLGLFALTIIAFALDTIGFKIMFEQNGLNGYWHDYIYYSIRVFGFDLQTPNLDTQIPWQLELGRWLSAFATIWAVALAVQEIFKDKLKLIRKGKKHIVIIGAGSKGKALGLDWMKENNNQKRLFVFIEKDKNNSNVDILKDEGAIIIFGDGKDKEVLEKAKIHDAQYVITLTDADSTNMEIISTLTKMQVDIKDKISCYIHLIHNEFYDFFMAQDFQNSSKLDIKIFNVNSNAARMLFIYNEDNYNETTKKYEPKILGQNVFTNRSTIEDPHTKVKIAIFGFEELGENILLHALQLGHFYNEKPIEITVVYDDDKDENKNLLDEFTKQYSIGIDKDKKTNTSFQEYWKIRFIDDGDFDKEDICEYSQIIIAYEDEFESLSNLMKMLKKYNDDILSNNIDICIYSNSFASTANIIKNDKKVKEDGALEQTVFKQVRTFGEIKKTCSYSMVIAEELDQKAMLNDQHYNKLHGYYNSLPTQELKDYENELYGKNLDYLVVIKEVAKRAKELKIDIVDFKAWDNLQMFLKDSNRYLMEHNEIKKYMLQNLIESSSIHNDYDVLKDLIAKEFFKYEGMNINWKEMGLRGHDYALKLSKDEIVQLAKAEHKRWNAFHILNGWKKLDIPDNSKEKIEKNKIRKLHPCLVSWEELDNVSENHKHDYKSDDIETIMRIPSLEEHTKDI